MRSPPTSALGYQYQRQKRSFGKEMKDEYGSMTSEGETFVTKDFVLEGGASFPIVQLRYQTYGSLNQRKDNVIVVCHALTGNASLHSWWGELLGKGKAFDTEKYMIVCCNILGSCYGSTNPQSIDPTTGSPYGKKFPDISVKDTVKLQLKLLKEELQISSVKAVVGGSFGGMQAMEYAIQAGSQVGDYFSADGKNNVRPTCALFGTANLLTPAMETAYRITISQICCSNSLWSVSHSLANSDIRGSTASDICGSNVDRRSISSNGWARDFKTNRYDQL